MEGIDKELVRKAVYAHVKAHEDERDSTPEKMLEANVPEEYIELWQRQAKVAHQAANKARELIFEAAWVIFKANLLLYETMLATKEQEGAAVTVLENRVLIRPKVEIILNEALNVAHDGLNKVLISVFKFMWHQYKEGCKDCDEVDCTLWQEMHRVNIE